VTRPITDDRDPLWVAYLAARKAERRAAARRRRLDAGAESSAAARVELDRLRAEATIPDLVALRDARFGDWRADLDRQIGRDPRTGAWTMRETGDARRRSA